MIEKKIIVSENKKIEREKISVNMINTPHRVCVLRIITRATRDHRERLISFKRNT